MSGEYFLTGYQDNQKTKLALQKNDRIYALDEAKVPSFEWLLQNISADELIPYLDNSLTGSLPDDTTINLNHLLTHQQIWASGVTYKTSEEARERESDNSTVYARVYSAERPEIFWKSIGYETVGNQDSVGIRYDATWSVPEPELTIVYNSRKEVIGFTIANDMSSRDIEGENPLYLPQAKVYDNACSIGPRIWLQPKPEQFPEVDIHIKIDRSGDTVFDGKTSTNQLHRSLDELSNYLGRCKSFPYGVFLMTGTGVVPPDDFTLAVDDRISITIEPIGQLINTVQVVGKDS